MPIHPLAIGAAHTTRKLGRGSAIVMVVGMAVLFNPCLTLADLQSITTTHIYVMGDNDSRNDARQICFLEAKRKVLEKAGSVIQTSSEVANFRLTKDQISSYSAAVLSVEIVKEEFGYSNGHNTLTLTVKADVDIDDVKKRLAAIVTDKGLQGRISEQQNRLQELESQVRQLSARLNMAPAVASGELRKERAVVFEDISQLERKKLLAAERIASEQETIRMNSEKIQRYIVPGMTTAEVEGILGKPYRIKGHDGYRIVEYCQDSPCAWYYGNLWVCFNAPLRRGDWRVYWAGNDALCSSANILK